MKKILIAFVAFCAVFSCAKYEHDNVDTSLAVPSVKLTIDSKSDSAFAFTVKPEAGTGYYSYTVLEGPVDKTVDAEMVLTVSCKGIAEACQTMASKDSVTCKLLPSDGILPNSVYTVYAVAANAKGYLGKLVTATLTTTDGNIPVLEDYDADKESASVAVVFNEPVTLSEAGGKAYAHYFKVYSPAAEAFCVEISKENILVDGNTVILSAPDTVSGAYVFFTWESGFVENGVGTPCPAYSRIEFVAEDGEIDKKSTRGVYARWPVVSFALTRLCNGQGGFMECPEDSVIAFTDLNDCVYTLGADSLIAGTGRSLTVSYKNAAKTTIFKDPSFDYEDDIVKLSYSSVESPVQGDYMHWTVADSSFFDCWGNYNEAYANTEDNYLYSYGYTTEDFCGTYEFTANSYFGAGMYTDTVTISKFNGDTVTVSGFGVNCPGIAPFTPTANDKYAVVDGVFGTLTFLAEITYGTTVADTTTYELSLCDNTWDEEPTDVQFSMPVKGQLNSQYSYFYWAFSEAGEVAGYWDVCFPESFTLLGSPAPTFAKPSFVNRTLNTKHKSIRR